ncbi:MAG: hypothetical protein J6M65_04775 [Eubacterium sp.]|nr:hypothetical protein [Eubacterium sp.]
MELLIQQTKKDLYFAEFSIYDKTTNSLLGQIWFNGSLGSIHGRFVIRYLNTEFYMDHVRKELIKEVEGSFIKQSVYKPYQITGSYSGYIWNDEEKISTFKNLGYRLLRLEGNSYYTYTVGFGDKGTCSPIYYNDDLYIGEIRKECKVWDDLHIFDVGVTNESAIPAIITTCHKWLTGYYKPGEIFKGWNINKYKSLMKEEIQKVRNPYYTT